MLKCFTSTVHSDLKNGSSLITFTRPFSANKKIKYTGKCPGILVYVKVLNTLPLSVTVALIVRLTNLANLVQLHVLML